MISDKGIKKQADGRSVVVSEQENKKIINPISIALIILSVALIAAAVHFPVIHWSILAIGSIILLILAASIRIADQWEKAVVLRMGKFIGLKGPGIFLIVPIIDRKDISRLQHITGRQPDWISLGFSGRSDHRGTFRLAV